VHRKLNENFILKILNVNSSLGLKIGGGTAERTFQMSRFLACQPGMQCTVLTLDIDLDETRIRALQPAKVVKLPCLSSRFYVPHGGWQTIQQLVDDSDVIHLMGHWSILNLLVYAAARRSNKPYVVCPAGALPVFGRSAVLKRIYNFMVGRSIIKNAQAWIAVTATELPNFEAYGVDSSKVLVIPNGVDEEDFSVADKQQFLARFKLLGKPFLLFMGRLNPIKGPDLLLQAFIQARHRFPSFHLVFVGPDGGLLPQLMQTVAKAGLKEWIHFLGYLSGAEKSAAYHCASLLVVPSRQEAMSIVAIEAGICGTPVLLTDQCGFGEVRSVDSRLEVPATVDGIAQGLVVLLQDAKCLSEIAPVWKTFVKQHYTLRAIVPTYLALYQSIRREQVAE
jgi:glycosyltransferase involved in cell wall biosynthesis